MEVTLIYGSIGVSSTVPMLLNTKTNHMTETRTQLSRVKEIVKNVTDKHPKFSLLFSLCARVLFLMLLGRFSGQSPNEESDDT
jgi:hypothetical protein